MGTQDRKTAPATRFSSLVNEEIRAIMGRRSITQAALAEMTGISQARISRMIFSDQASLPISLLEQVAKSLGVESSEILRRAEAVLAHELATTPNPPPHT